MSDYDEKEEMFARLAEAKYAQQADLDDYVTDTSEETAKPEVSTDEIIEKKNRIEELKKNQKHWEFVRSKAIKQKIDSKRIGKVTQQINKIVAEIAEAEHWLREQVNPETKRQNEIDRIEGEIDTLEQERNHIENRLEMLAERLRALKPHSEDADYINDPRQLYVDEEEDMERLYELMAERRRACQEAGEYNSSNNFKVLKKGGD